MNKRNLISGAILTSAAIIASQSAEAKTKGEQPNILFICIDDLRTQIGAYGHENMVTPNLDAIASNGLLFNNQYVQVPTSGASRAAMLTGVNPKEKIHTTNHWFTEALIESTETEKPESFVHHLRRNGYYTVGMGKISHSPDGGTDYNDDYIAELPFSWDKFVVDEDSPWPKGDGLLHSYANGASRYDGTGYAPAFESLDVPDESYPDGVVALQATSTLEELAKSDKPFFMAVGFFKPHLPFSAPKKYWDMYKSEDVELSANRDVPQGVDEVFLHNSGEFAYQYTHPEKAKMGKILSEEYSRDLRHAYFAAMSYTDAQVGKVMDKLKELGLDKNTVVVVWGDHGWHLGDHTMWGKHSTFERSLNSTFIVSTPDMEQKGAKTDALVATVDIYPTLCELTGIEAPEGIDGTSFVPVLKNPKAKTRTEVLSYWTDALTIRNDRYRLSLYDDGKTERIMLFDHLIDPYETINVAEHNPKVVDQLMKKMKKLGNGFLPSLKE
ncbi:MAG: sulfatase [Rikenellaceae bacterium]